MEGKNQILFFIGEFICIIQQSSVEFVPYEVVDKAKN